MKMLHCAQRNPEEILSDNAKQFKLANSVLGKMWETIIHDEDVLSYVSGNGITWNFIVELPPWQGGAYKE